MTSKSSKPLESLNVRHVRHVVRFIAYARANDTQKTPLGTEPEDMSHMSHGSFLGVGHRGGRGAPAFRALQNFWNLGFAHSGFSISRISRNPGKGDAHDRL